jgi:hypothetical protein
MVDAMNGPAIAASGLRKGVQGQGRARRHRPGCPDRHDLRLLGVTGRFASVDDLLTGEENLLMTADLLHLPKAEGEPAARCPVIATHYCIRAQCHCTN